MSFTSRLTTAVVRLLALLLGVLGLWVILELGTLPAASRLAESNPMTTAFIERYSEGRRDTGEGKPAQWDWVSYANISANLKGAVLVSEDIEFFSHDGFSTTEIRAAITEAIEEQDMPRGASTITQQVAKNLWLSPSRNPWRKIKEAILTRRLERDLTKDRIFELYLNVVEFGPGIYGAEAAARHYFNKSAANLTSWEASLLTAGLPRPRSWHPGVESNAYLARAERIEYLMHQHADFLQRRFGTANNRR